VHQPNEQALLAKNLRLASKLCPPKVIMLARQ